MHRATARFWKTLERLPEPIQRVAHLNFELLKNNPAHPSLHFKKTGNFWSARVGIDYRALAVEDGADFIWVWVGPHDEYQRLIKQQR
jgi:mRNA-degrading endonuclease RelE of RelBE toxin-antitoxin system